MNLNPPSSFSQNQWRMQAGVAIMCGGLAIAAMAWGNPPDGEIAPSGPRNIPALQTLPDGQFAGGGIHAPLQGWAKKSMAQPTEGSMETPTANRVLNGRIQTLQQAAQTEKDRVDWYAWYLNARDYLFRTGGLDCRAGTLIRFYKSGEIRAMTADEDCLASIGGRRFPLPPATGLHALVLPVRPTELPPASPQEIRHRVHVSF